MLIDKYIFPELGNLKADASPRSAVIEAVNEVDYEVSQRLLELGAIQEKALIMDTRRRK